MNRIPAAEVPNKCSTCVLGKFCLPLGLNAEDADQIDTIITERVRLKKGETLYRQNDPLNAVYGVRVGTLKTLVVFQDGREQVTGFHLPGEILGLGGIGEHHHHANACALEDSEVCVIQLSQLEDLARQLPSLQHQLHRIMSKEINQYRLHLLALGSMRAEERLANFLLNLSSRFAARGYSASEFNLRMSREEIGSYLGMQIETVSRLLSRFTEGGLLQIKLRNIRIIDMDGLARIAGHTAPAEAIQPASSHLY
jgi:CRP/FNR family transcriptional regulator